MRKAENFEITVPLVLDIRSFSTNLPKIFGSCLFFNICHQDLLLKKLLLKKSPENFGLRTKRPLAFSDESKVQLLHVLELSTGPIIGVANSFRYHEKANTKAEISERINSFLGELQINQTGIQTENHLRHF